MHFTVIYLVGGKESTLLKLPIMLSYLRKVTREKEECTKEMIIVSLSLQLIVLNFVLIIEINFGEFTRF